MQFLSHPLTILFLGVFLINDHLLRRLWPSWLSGKLGDFAWLYVAPAIAAALLAWLIPANLKRQEKITGLLAYGLTTLAFTLTKTISLVHDFVIRCWQTSLGFPVNVVIDPTDLLALYSLALSGIVWFSLKPILRHVPLRGWLVLPLFALLTIADSAAPDYGINCLYLQDNHITTGGYQSFTSHDGGLTWVAAGYNTNQDHCTPKYEPIKLPGAQLRYFPGSRIEISHDDGQTWQVEFHLAGSREARDAYDFKLTNGYAIITPAPLDVVFDPASGNVIFAMGHDGLLVRSPDATYTWASAGQYNHPEFPGLSAFFFVLGGELALAGDLIFLLLATWMLIIRKTGWVIKSIVICAWLIWAFNTIIIPPAWMGGYSSILSWICILFVSLLAIPFGIYGFVAFLRTPIPRVPLTAITCSLIFLLPYLLWYINAIPNYTISTIASALIALISAVAGFIQIRRLTKEGSSS